MVNQEVMVKITPMSGLPESSQDGNTQMHVYFKQAQLHTHMLHQWNSQAHSHQNGGQLYIKRQNSRPPTVVSVVEFLGSPVMCKSVLGQDAEPKIATSGSGQLHGVCCCVWKWVN